jgi:3-isopropylmalate/(R)-2-methylmalate dehydratase small subunit
MILYAPCRVLGDAVSTDLILPPERRAADDPAEWAAWCLSGVDPQLPEQLQEGDALLAGTDFGIGAEAEIAVLALQAAGITAIVCVSAAPMFAEAARRLGLPVIICPEAVRETPDGAVLRLDLVRGDIEARASGKRYRAEPCPPDVVAAVRQTHMLTRMRRMVEEEGFDG